MKIAFIVALIAVCYTGNNTTQEARALKDAQWNALWLEGFINTLTSVKYEPTLPRCDA